MLYAESTQVTTCSRYTVAHICSRGKESESVWGLTEQYSASKGDAPPGLYCYNFCLHTDPSDTQPSGAMNLSKFNQVEFVVDIRPPPLDPSAQVTELCAPPDLPDALDRDGRNAVIGVDKPAWRVYKYNYVLTVMEERYNILSFAAGNAGLEFSR